MRLLAYTDNVELGGADISMGHLLAGLDPSTVVTVMGVSPAIVDRVAAARDGAATVTVPAPKNDHDWRSFAAHARAMEKVSPDIVHANLSSPWSCQYAIAAAALARKARIVAVYHLAVPPVSARQRWAKRVTARFVDAHVGVGDRMSRDVETVIGLPPGSLQTIHNGIPDVALGERPQVAPPPVITTIGRLEHQKGIDTLIRSLANVEAGVLVVVGEGKERQFLEQVAEDTGVTERVIWIGWSDDPRSYLARTDVFVLPSRFEGFPLVLLEALLARRAVVASDVGSVREAVRHEQTGLLVPPGDVTALATALRRLLGDADLRTRLGEAGRDAVVSEFSVGRMVEGYQSLYETLRA